MSAIDVSLRGRLGAFRLDAAFTAPACGVTALFGPSGCGKTTILRCIAGLQQLDGRCVVAGDSWQEGATFRPPHRRPVGYVFQEASLFPHLSVRRNLLFGASGNGLGRNAKRLPSPLRGGWPERSGGPGGGRAGNGSRGASCTPPTPSPSLQGRGEGAASLDDIVSLLGLGILLDRAPHHLSGGERQRVAIGRALLSRPAILLMDEPLSALDRAAKDEILPFLERLYETASVPILYVTHDMSEVERLADHIVLMERGRVVASGPLATVQSNPDLPLAAGREAAVSLDATVAGHNAESGLSRLDVAGASFLLPGGAAPIGTRRRLRVGAGDVSLALTKPENSTILNVLPARILSVSAAGPHEMVAVLALGHEGEGARLLSRVTRHSWQRVGLAVGQDVFAQVKSVALIRNVPQWRREGVPE